MPPTGDLAHNPGMCPDWELNPRPFGLQASTQSTEPHQPGPERQIFLCRREQKHGEVKQCANTAVCAEPGPGTLLLLSIPVLPWPLSCHPQLSPVLLSLSPSWSHGSFFYSLCSSLKKMDKEERDWRKRVSDVHIFSPRMSIFNSKCAHFSHLPASFLMQAIAIPCQQSLQIALCFQFII